VELKGEKTNFCPNISISDFLVFCFGRLFASFPFPSKNVVSNACREACYQILEKCTKLAEINKQNCFKMHFEKF